MPLPGSEREKKLLQEINTPVVEEVSQPQFLQEIKEPTHEELIVEETPKRTRRTKKN
jgi:hypothetical protein